MRKVKLYTRDGGYVATVEIPTTRPGPEGIMWGERTFFLNTSGTHHYVEGLLFYVRPNLSESTPA